jgi:leucyl aminopeptidase
MPSSALATALSLTTAQAGEIATDLLVLPVFEEDRPDGELRAADQASGGSIGRGMASGEVQGRPYQTFVTPVTGGWRAGRIALVGAGKRAEYTTERLRRVATAAALQARRWRAARLAWVDRGGLESTAAVQAAAEGLVLASFSGDGYKSGERGDPSVEELVVAVPDPVDADAPRLQQALERGRVLGESSNLARGLCNEPSNVLTPSVFADRAAEICGEAGVAVTVLGEREIAELGMGLLLGVARGSAEPPRVIVMRHEPAGAPAAPVLGLVGKGITFDTGGISIKPAEGMERMKDDMAGGAAVIGAMRAISVLEAPIRVVGIVPASENMPGGRAVKPGDVLTAACGKTVEVINTDAEGRLILGDGLWYAQQLGATHLIDVATLTGACVVALGKAASGVFGQPDGWVEVVRRTAQRAGDRCWPMPLYEEYAEQLRSEIADMTNTGGRPAGACTAAMFLKEFAGGKPWVHLDIAGTAWADEAKPWQPKGASGVAVRTLAELAFTSAEWK